MKSYLSLIPISVKVRKKQNRMTILCIVISVLLVTTIFSVADMMIRSESNLLIANHGNWHLKVENSSSEMVDELCSRSDVTAVGSSSDFNLDAEQPYFIGKAKTALHGSDETYLTQIANGIESGTYPQNDHEVLLTSNAVSAFNLQIGDSVTIRTPAGSSEYIISGFGSDDVSYYEGQFYLVGVYMTPDAFSSLMSANGVDVSLACYIQFRNAAAAANAKNEVLEQYQLSDDSVSENTAVMSISGHGSSEQIKNVYGLAAILFVLVLLAGIFMISGSMNSNVSQRTKFFGMMRCIGASRQQIIRFVRLEALNSCKVAVPIGVLCGTLLSWIVCGFLHYGIGGEFATTPVFKFSLVGILSGIAIGVITVLFAAQSPARRASKVSPIAAVSGNAENSASVYHALRSNFGKIECRLGIHHAFFSKKNWWLMTASFALSIILFFSFTVIMDFSKLLLPSLTPWQPDIVLNGYANAPVLERSFIDEIQDIPGVCHSYGCSFAESVPVECSRTDITHVNLVSYDDFMLEKSKGSVVSGDLSTVYGNNGNVMIVYSRENPLRPGETLSINGTDVTITCALSQGLFSDSPALICSEETFAQLIGNQNYSIIGIQLDKNAPADTVAQINSLVSGDVIISDQSASNKNNYSTYLASRVVIYCFLGIIGMITLLYIINTISMSVSARIKQYGAMRAVGMDTGQLSRMILAEAFTYAISGLIFGCIFGIMLNRFLYTQLITRFFGISWQFPVTAAVIVILFVLVSALLSVYAPAKRIQNMEIAETINEL